MLLGMQAAAQEHKATWGGDINVNPSVGRYYKNARVSVGYDGTIYVGRLWASSPTGQYQNWEVLKSTDTGHTFTVLQNESVFGGNQYRSFDMLAAGANAADFKIFVAYGSHDTTAVPVGQNRIRVQAFNAAGIQQSVLVDEVDTNNDGHYRSWESISLSSDWKEPNAISAPYELDIAAVKAHTYDSIIVWASKNGGAAVTRRSLYGTLNFLKSVSSSIGSTISSTSMYGRLGVIWDEFALYSDIWGQLKAQFMYADDASDPGINAGLQTLAGIPNFRHPCMVMSQQTGTVTGPGDSDIRTMVVYETDLVTGNYSTVASNCTDSLIRHNIDFSVNAIIKQGTVSGGALDAHAIFDPMYNNFMITYYDSATQALVYSLKPLSASLAFAPLPFCANYRDASTDLGTPAFPRTDINTVNHQAVFVWNDNNHTMLDAEYALPASVQRIPLNASDVQVFPNPANDVLNVAFIAEKSDKISTSIYDITGRQILVVEASIDAGVNKIPVTVSDLPAGNYIVTVKGGSVSFNARFTRQ